MVAVHAGAGLPSPAPSSAYGARQRPYSAPLGFSTQRQMDQDLYTHTVGLDCHTHTHTRCLLSQRPTFGHALCMRERKGDLAFPLLIFTFTHTLYIRMHYLPAHPTLPHHKSILSDLLTIIVYLTSHSYHTPWYVPPATRESSVKQGVYHAHTRAHTSYPRSWAWCHAAGPPPIGQCSPDPLLLLN